MKFFFKTVIPEINEWKVVDEEEEKFGEEKKTNNNNKIRYNKKK